MCYFYAKALFLEFVGEPHEVSFYLLKFLALCLVSCVIDRVTFSLRLLCQSTLRLLKKLLPLGSTVVLLLSGRSKELAKGRLVAQYYVVNNKFYHAFT